MTTTANSGGGSLRQAIIDANANADLTVIRFNIAGSCTNNLISPSTLLPDVTTPIILDGYTQPGSERNTVGLGDNDGTICVGLSGSDTLEWGLRTPPGDSDARLEVYGLAFRRFTDAAIKLESGKVHVIRGNRFSIGLGAAGSTVISGASRRHIVLLSGATRSVIGGADPGDRNYFALAVDEAILLSASTLTTADIGQHVVLNNYIGSNLDGDNDFGNGIGIRVSGRDNFIEDNLVSGNLGDGILVQGSEANGNRIAGNTIGLKRTTLLGTFDLPNLGSGVRIAEGDNNDVVNNRIAHNGLDGITVIEGNGNTIRGGSIYSNVGQGVDLGDDGADTNNNDGAIQPVGSPNWFRNYPVLAQALHAESVLRVVGSLESVESTFTIDLFSQGASTCDELSNGHVNGEARTYEGSFVVTIENAPFGQNGRVDFDITLAASRADFTGQTVTAIATDASGNSSELSACTPLTAWILFADGFESGDTSAWN